MATAVKSRATTHPSRRVAIVGAGPIGIEAAARGVRAGHDVHVYEAGEVGQHVRNWGHVVLFTPFRMNHSPIGDEAIAAEHPDHKLPLDDAFISGREYVERYLLPLASTSLLNKRIHTRHRVVSIGRTGFLKNRGIGDAQRAANPFRLLIEMENQVERCVEADVVIDASGTYGQPNWVGRAGIPSMGERSAGGFVRYHVDDILGHHRPLYEGKRTVLVGAGNSAATSVVALKRLVDEHPDTHVVWLTSSDRDLPIREIPDDQLHARLQLAQRANQIATENHPRLKHMPGVEVDRIEPLNSDTVVVHAVDPHGRSHLFEVDRVLGNVGYRPDRTIYDELHIHECYGTGAPMKLAASLLERPTVDCMKREAAPTDALLNPEPNFFIVGAKSYGRDATFLMRTGIAQVDQLFALLEPVTTG